ncbi:MAG TPA: sigma-70 family RNA polymerase sigma factor [Bacteroidota bacterium]|nr:sigma-70 family RNA polymerase sigma factor [Bacteroidota bacterium]
MKKHASEKQKAFEQEALPHTDLLYNYALRMTNNPADADDLVQETYLKAYRFWDSYEQGTNIRAWLFRILKNSYINRYRREVREPDTVEYDDVKSMYAARGDAPGEGNDVQESMFGHLLDDEITGAIASLPDEFRTVVILCDIEGLTYEEVAAFMECPLGTVRSRLHRGRKLLRGKLAAYARSRGLVHEE